MYPAESRLPRFGGATKRTTSKSRSTRPPPSVSSMEAPPTSFAATPLRTKHGGALDDISMLVFDEGMAGSHIPTAPVQQPFPPPSALVAEELAGFDPFAQPAAPPPRYIRRPASLKYTVPYGRRSNIVTSFEPTIEETPDMLLDDEGEPETPRISAPVKLLIPVDERRQPKVIPSFERTPGVMPEIYEESPLPAPEPAPLLRHAVAEATPAPVKLEITMDDRRRSKVIPTYERTPEEMLPPIEQPVKRRQTSASAPRYSYGGVMWEFPIGSLRAGRPRVRRSYGSDEEMPMDFPAYPPEPIVRPIRQEAPPPTQQRPRRFQKKHPTSARRATGISPTTQPPLLAAYTAPPKPKKLPPKPQITPEEKVVRKKPPPPPQELKAGTVLQVGPEVTRGAPPEACTRTITSMYYSKPPQKGATLAKVCEEVVEVHGGAFPETPQDMMAMARKRMAAATAVAAATAPPPPMVQQGGRKPALMPKPSMPKVVEKPLKKASKRESEMMAMARKRRSEALTPAAYRSQPQPLQIREIVEPTPAKQTVRTGARKSSTRFPKLGTQRRTALGHLNI